MNEVDRINSRGVAAGWHAEQLQREAARTGASMADLFRARAEKFSAFTVPATCTKIAGGFAYYSFLDGSTDRYPHQPRERK